MAFDTSDDDGIYDEDDDDDDVYLPCPHCGEQILEAADYCPYCDQWLTGHESTRSRLSWWAVLIILVLIALTVGSVLPML